DGSQVNAVYGFTRALLELLQDWQPEYAAAAFDDGSGSTFRTAIAPEYKRTRPAMPERLASQLGPAMEAARVLGVPALQAPGFEADDILATLTQCLRAEGIDCLVVSNDK